MATAQIIGTGLYAPERVVPNAYFNELYGEDVDAFLRANRNIHERRYAAEGQHTSDLAVAAATDALADAGLGPGAIDLIIVSTDTPDYLSPSTAAIVQHKLGATGAATFDLNTACAGFVTALETGKNYLAGNPDYTHVLVISAYLMSRFIDYDFKNTATLFADGAGAAVLTRAEDGTGILTSELTTKGEFSEHMGIYVGGAAAPANAAAQGGDGQAKEQLLEFRQKFPDGFNPDHWTALVETLADRVGAQPSDVDHLFFTQINVQSINETMNRLGLPDERAHKVMDRFGYTGNACVPMALADAADQHRLGAGDLVFLVASGGGAAIAGMALRWAYDT